MAKSGLRHIDVGAELTKTEWESEESHEIIHGNGFPDSPVERQLFYRDDEHKWYIYDGTDWVWLGGGSGGGMEVHGNEYHDPDFEQAGTAAAAVETHRTTETHTQAQPPAGHGNEKHNPDFAETSHTHPDLSPAHKDITTGVHGVGESTVESASGSQAKVDAHKDLTTGVHGAGENHLALAPDSNHLVRSFTKGWTSGKILVGAGADANPSEAYEVQAYWGTSPTIHEWQLEFSPWTATTTGTGSSVTKNYGMCKAETGTGANCTARARGYGYGWIGWGTFLLQSFCQMCARTSIGTAKRWYKIDDDTAADPTGCAIGWRLDNLALKGIVHNGTTLYVIDLATTLTSDGVYSCMMLFKYGVYCQWYVGGVLKGEETDPAHLPSTLRQANHYPVLAITNGASGGACSLEIWSQGWTRR